MNDHYRPWRSRVGAWDKWRIMNMPIILGKTHDIYPGKVRAITENGHVVYGNSLYEKEGRLSNFIYDAKVDRFRDIETGHFVPGFTATAFRGGDIIEDCEDGKFWMYDPRGDICSRWREVIAHRSWQEYLAHKPGFPAMQHGKEQTWAYLAKASLDIA